MRRLLPIFLCTLFFINSAIADQRKTLFEGFRMELVSGRDAMTDEEWGAIFVHFGALYPLYIAIYGHDHFVIFGHENKQNSLHFAPDGDHLIRLGKNKPFPLEYVSRKNGLRPLSKAHAEAVIKSFVKGEEVKLRFYTWPSYEKVDFEKLQKPNLAFLYKRAVDQFGWKDFGVPGDLAPATLRIYIPEEDPDGYASLHVVESSGLGLDKHKDKWGGGCWITVGINKVFGIKNGKWCCDIAGADMGSRIIIHDSHGKIAFEGKIPKGFSEEGSWFLKKAGKAAWEAAPLGNIEVKGKYGEKVILYGFRELWKWGIDNAGLPSLE